MKIYDYLLNLKSRAGYLPLIDPDKFDESQTIELAIRCQQAGADAILIGGSLLMQYGDGSSFDGLLKKIKSNIDIPIIIFPGNSNQLSKHTDALLYLSLVSGRNPHWLINEHVTSAPIIKKLGIEAISTAYMLIESGITTSVQFMSNTRPIPRNKKDIAVAHALASEYLGMKLIYLEGGSGARYSVPEDMIFAVKQNSSLPIIVGGGIRTPEVAKAKIQAGADFIVTGTIIEDNSDLLKEFAEIIHSC